MERSTNDMEQYTIFYLEDRDNIKKGIYKRLDKGKTYGL